MNQYSKFNKEYLNQTTYLIQDASGSKFEKSKKSS